MIIEKEPEITKCCILRSLKFIQCVVWNVLPIETQTEVGYTVNFEKVKYSVVTGGKICSYWLGIQKI